LTVPEGAIKLAYNKHIYFHGSGAFEAVWTKEVKVIWNDREDWIVIRLQPLSTEEYGCVWELKVKAPCRKK
jgi:hypothetical protein